jgi:hypothetical protein
LDCTWSDRYRWQLANGDETACRITEYGEWYQPAFRGQIYAPKANRSGLSLRRDIFGVESNGADVGTLAFQELKSRLRSSSILT